MSAPRLNFVDDVLNYQGRRREWLALQMGVSPSLITKVLSGERGVSERFRREACRVLQLPEHVLFPVDVLTVSGFLLSRSTDMREGNDAN